MSPESPFSPSNYNSPENKEFFRPQELFRINSNTTDLICCIHGEIASPSLTYACRQKGLDSVSCIAGGVTGLAYYFKHTLDAESVSELLEICHPQYQLPNFKNELDKHVFDDTGYNFHDYYDSLFRQNNLTRLTVILHDPSVVTKYYSSGINGFFTTIFPDLQSTVFSDLNQAALQQYRVSTSELDQARQKITAQAVLVQNHRY